MRDYAKINFYKEFDRTNTLHNEVAEFITNEGENSGFYELCAEFLDIALDAPKFKDGKTSIIQKDFEGAATSALIYIEEHDISDVHGLLDLIYEHHSHALRMNETRPTSGRVMEYDSYGYGIGTLYDFSKIPKVFWKDIKSWIMSKIEG